jgi:hypothetical protein
MPSYGPDCAKCGGEDCQCCGIFLDQKSDQFAESNEVQSALDYEDAQSNFDDADNEDNYEETEDNSTDVEADQMTLDGVYGAADEFSDGFYEDF